MEGFTPVVPRDPEGRGFVRVVFRWVLSLRDKMPAGRRRSIGRTLALGIFVMALRHERSTRTNSSGFAGAHLLEIARHDQVFFYPHQLQGCHLHRRECNERLCGCGYLGPATPCRRHQRHPGRAAGSRGTRVRVRSWGAVPSGRDAGGPPALHRTGLFCAFMSAGRRCSMGCRSIGQSFLPLRPLPGDTAGLVDVFAQGREQGPAHGMVLGQGRRFHRVLIQVVEFQGFKR